MQKCKVCGMPDTRPNSVFSFGICQACINYEQRKGIRWDEKRTELKHKIQGANCLVAVSGGKDSHWICKTITDLGVNNFATICVHDWFTPSLAGTHNLKNLIKLFNMQHIDWQPPYETFINNTRRDFETSGEPLAWIETMIYQVPLDYKKAFDFDYVIFGENSAVEYGGRNTLPGIDVLYISDYIPWDDIEHYEVAKSMGFKDLTYFNDWDRKHHPEPFSQIDSIGYPVHLFLKYPKFGFQRVTDIATRRVRAGHWTKEEAEKEIKEHDHLIDQTSLNDFCNTLGYGLDDFWAILRHAKWNIFYKENIET